MKPVFAKILENLKEQVFAVRIIDLPYFSTEFHFHKECQMVYVVESEGKRIIGDSVESFESDELILLGSDIPHVWHNDKSYFEKDKEAHARSLALFFEPEKLVELLSHFVAIKKLEALLKTAQRGMKFSGAAKELLKQLLLDMSKQDDLNRMISLLKIIELLTATKEYELLASGGYVNTYQAKDNDRIDKVFKYVFTNFTNEIQLDDVAALVNMNKQAFCRYFKSRTQKTFVEFVNDIRISHACKLLTEGESPIAGLSYDCGFNSLSNFNRIFKEVKGVSPREYKKMIAAE
ncbi:MAG: helix-turn-helix domain-containing protein [Chitinophagaceae bacterium]|nr:helix-turn-helix domain-containing protein [Chitinophagaceae bacterium]